MPHGKGAEEAPPVSSGGEYRTPRFKLQKAGKRAENKSKPENTMAHKSRRLHRR